jgi:hypothetical protein
MAVMRKRRPRHRAKQTEGQTAEAPGKPADAPVEDVRADLRFAKNLWVNDSM